MITERRHGTGEVSPGSARDVSKPKWLRMMMMIDNDDDDADDNDDDADDESVFCMFPQTWRSGNLSSALDVIA